MKKTTILIIAFLSLGLSSAIAQKNFNKALGLRFGLPTGITFKGSVSKTDALEGILHFNENYLGFTGLYERHGKLGAIPEISVFYGAGLGIATYNRNNHNYNNHNGSSISLGFDMILGIDYTFESIPINLSLDIKPTIILLEDSYSHNFGDIYPEAALSARYCF
jgi:hypothetical protein